MGRNAAHLCPHCRRPARVRSSRAVTPLYRQLNLQCTNVDCGHTYAAAIEILYSIVPSAHPDPAIDLRRAPPRRVPIAANDGGSVPGVTPPPSNDDDPLAEAVFTGG
ncbi:MAG: transcriptional regulator [Sphingomonas sanxanigenens]|uniref:Transcriptional regulator n=1 Tax=Sphingomonas sanxanigenens TaxID=397260 RepID=A0A2W5A246_9SPHN|nr:MAG: transcriptional regulator [Sphingomonas sanxanigenens]